MPSDFERRVEQYLEIAGWERVDPLDIVVTWAKTGRRRTFRAAFYSQLKEDFETSGDIERAAEILERSR